MDPDWNDPVYDEYLSTGVDPTGCDLDSDCIQDTYSEEYIDSEGNVYESYEAYCNSPNLDEYTIMLKLHAGTRIPQNDWERKLLSEMREIEASGKQIDFSENIW